MSWLAGDADKLESDARSLTMKPRRTANPKRKLVEPTVAAEFRSLGSHVSYGGNPEHKRNPGDFNLSPPAIPRQGKSLCDDAGVVRRQDALDLLKRAFERGTVSVQARNGWPKNVWAVTEGGVALEAMLENHETGAYHGYPMLPIDPLRDEVLMRWGAP